jgi:hypothetical protein
MSATIVRWSAIAAVGGLFVALASGCVVGGGYGYDGEVGVGADYYEPYGAVYGGWGPGYNVAPFRGGDHRGGGGGHAFRAAPAGRAMPSIPSGGRSGGSHRR